LLATLLALTGCTPLPSPTVAPTATALPGLPTIAPSPTPTATPGPPTLIYWEEETDAGDVLLDELAAQFMQENPDVLIERAHFPYDELSLLFRTAALSGRAPDLIRAPGEFTAPFSELEIVAPLEELVAPQDLDGFLPGALEAVQVGERSWGLPDNYGDHLMLIYNLDLVGDVPPNTDAWIAQLKTLTDPAQGRYGLVYNLNEPFWVIPWISGFGGWPIDAQGNPTLNTDEVVDALRFVQDLKLVHRVTPDTADYDAAYNLFRSGQAAYIIDGAWNVDRYVGSGLRLGVAALPAVAETGLRPGPMASGKHWFIPTQTQGERREMALRFAGFMTSAAAQEAWLTRMRRLPSDAGVGERARSSGADPLLAGALDQLRYARGLPPAQEMPCIWQAMAPELSALMAGAQTSEGAAEAMQTQATFCVEDLRALATPEAQPQ
jgi:maltose-binding protein MalE